MSGWFAMKRGTLDHEMFAPSGKWSKFEAWVWMVESAAYKPTTIDIGNRPYTIPRGSLCFSERFMAGKFRWSQTALRTFLRQLERHGAVKITVAKTGSGTKAKRKQITLCNYDKYQSSEIKTKSKRKQNESKEEQITNNNTFSNEKEQASPVPISVLTKAVWDCGVQYLTSKGIETRQARSVLGKWRKDSGDAQILEAIESAQRAGTEDPIPYITKTLQGDEAFDVMAALAKLRKERA